MNCIQQMIFDMFDQKLVVASCYSFYTQCSICRTLLEQKNKWMDKAKQGENNKRKEKN